MVSNEQAETPGLKIIPLGGLGEIGLNMMVLECNDSIVLIDAGLMFPEDDMLGIDIVIPDFSYLIRKKALIRALVVTHGHEDHIGAIPFLLREITVPIYATPLARALINEKLKDHSLNTRVDLQTVLPGETITVGPFQIEFIQVCHSIPDGAGLAIQTPEGIIVHSGDFKIDNTPIDGRWVDLARFGTYGKKGVLALLSDSTNVERPGHTLSEREVGKTLKDIFQESTGRIIVAVFSSNLHRIQQVIHLARAFGRKVLLNGRSMLINVRIGRELGYLDFPQEEEINLQEMNRLHDSQVVLLTTGSQGEPMSALTRMAFDGHKKLKIKAGDTVILSSKFIPGNERTIHNIINRLYRQGAEVIHEQVRDTHVSGHAYQEELKTLISVVKPKYLIPIHGEYRHLVKHRQLGMGMGIPEENCLLLEDGDVAVFHGGEVRLSDRVETGRILVDGKGVGDVEGVVLRDRRHLSEDGLVIATLVIHKETREILNGPDILSKGFIHEESKPEVIDNARYIVLEVFNRLVHDDFELDCTLLQAEIKRELKRFFNRLLYRRPVIYALVTDI